MTSEHILEKGVADAVMPDVTLSNPFTKLQQDAPDKMHITEYVTELERENKYLTNSRRDMFAAAALTGLCANTNTDADPVGSLVSMAVTMADALIKKLNSNQGK